MKKKSSIAELEQALAQAKFDEKKERELNFMKPFHDLVGRCFITYRKSGGHASSANSRTHEVMGFIRYGGSVTYDAGSYQGSSGQMISYERARFSFVERVYASTAFKTFPYDGTGIRVTRHDRADFSTISDAIQDHRGEITVHEFNTAKDSAQYMSELILKSWRDGHKVEEWPEPKITGEEDMDVPHIILEDGEYSLVDSSIFRIGHKYLMSPNSIAYALTKIAQQQAMDARCAHLYEACDHYHVERTRAAINSLTRKLNSWNPAHHPSK